MATRRVRAFKRWMKSQGIEFCDALDFPDVPGEGVSVRALCDLKEGDVVAKIPKSACLTIKTTAACDIIEPAGMDGCLGLAVAVMFEKSLRAGSPWAGYLQLLPEKEDIPLVWSVDEVDQLLRGTELHKVVKEDKALVVEDWKENILPLLDSLPPSAIPEFFGVEQYFSAKSLIASRSFEIDDFHGFGMVPLADLFNHKTGAEDVHFTSMSSHSDSDDAENDGNIASADNAVDKKLSSELGSSLATGDDPEALEMIMVKDVNAGAEVFNTYGLLGNAALLHRYGFTEPDNPYDIVNIDLDLVMHWSLAKFSSRHARSRLSLWRNLEFSGCISQNSEYFEISCDGEPQIELLILLYVLLLPEDVYHDLDLAVAKANSTNGSVSVILSEKCSISRNESSEVCRDLLLTKSVRSTVLRLADIRESLYGSNKLEDDIEELKACCPGQRKLSHSLMLRISERRILKKLRAYALAGAQSTKPSKRSSTRKCFKRARKLHYASCCLLHNEHS